MAIFWKKGLRASPIQLPDCDRMCGLQVDLACTARSLFIFLPSADQPQDVYTSVENSISQLSNKGPLLILGNLNVHLGGSSASTNSRALLG